MRFSQPSAQPAAAAPALSNVLHSSCMSYRGKIHVDLSRTAVGEALELGRQVALRQVRLFHEKAAQGPFSDREASAFQKVMNTLVALETEHRAREAARDLTGLSEEQLAALEGSARQTLGLPAAASHLDAYELDSRSANSRPVGALGGKK